MTNNNIYFVANWKMNGRLSLIKRLKNVADARVYSKRHDLFGEYIIANVIIDSKYGFGL